MLLDEVTAKRHEIRALGERYGARHLRVFGSVARREDRVDSDIDLLVDLPPGYDFFAQRMALMNELAILLNRRVELIPEHELSRHIRARVLSEAIAL